MTNPNDIRLQQLEAENARLREQLARTESRLKQEQSIIRTCISERLPKTDEEMLRLLSDSRPSCEVMSELEREFGSFSPGGGL